MTDTDYTQFVSHIEFLNSKFKQINDLIDPILAKKVYLGSRESHKALKAIITAVSESNAAVLGRLRTKGQNYNFCTLSEIYMQVVNDVRIPDLLNKLKMDQLNTIFAEIAAKKAEVVAACDALKQKYAKNADNKQRAQKEQAARVYQQQLDAYVETYREYYEILRILYDAAHRLFDNMYARNMYIVPLNEHINILADAIRNRKIIQIDPTLTLQHARRLFEQGMFYSQNPERVKTELKAWAEFKKPASDAWKSAHPWLTKSPSGIYQQLEGLYAQMINEYKQAAKDAAARKTTVATAATAAPLPPKAAAESDGEEEHGMIAPGAFSLGEPVKEIYNEKAGWVENPEYNAWAKNRAANMYRSKFNVPESFEMHPNSNSRRNRRRSARTRRNRRVSRRNRRSH